MGTRRTLATTSGSLSRGIQSANPTSTGETTVPRLNARLGIIGVNRISVNTDAGPQYTSLRWTEHLALEEIRPSIGSVGDAYDNALMESINGLYKAECIRTTVFHDGPYKTIADVEYATAGWVDWYNNRRLRSTLGKVPPVEYEQAHYAALNREPHPV